MRRSLRDIQLLEAFLGDKLRLEERESVKRRLLLEPELYAQLQQQQRTNRLIRLSGRRRLKREIEKIHLELFSTKENQDWRERILRFFR